MSWPQGLYPPLVFPSSTPGAVVKGGISQLKAGLGSSSIAGVSMFKTLCRSCLLGFQLSLFSFLVVLAHPFSLCQCRAVFPPSNTCCISSSLLHPSAGCWVQQQAREGQSSVLPTGGHCHHSISGQLLQSQGHPAADLFCVFFSTCKNHHSPFCKVWCIRKGELSQLMWVRSFLLVMFFFVFPLVVFGKHWWSCQQNQIENTVSVSPFHCISDGVVWLPPGLHKYSLYCS